MYRIFEEQFLPISLSRAWKFFSSPNNLALITPPQLGFKVLTPINDNNGIYEGMIIDYRVTPLFHIPLHWQTKIENVEAEKAFTDIQVKGPYQTWEHTHTFIESNGGVVMQDDVNYQLPFGFAGKAVHKLLVKNKLQEIFDFRKRKLMNLFSYDHQ